jgi:DNA-binding NarL/FixJ family response regulator
MDLCGATTVLIATSYEPSIDNVMGLLMKGARGFLRKPFSIDYLEEAFDIATKGEPFNESVLSAKDRNEALLGIVMSCLDRFATIARQAAEFETAQRELQGAKSAFRRSIHLARTFAQGGDPGYLNALEYHFIERAKGPATRLGRIRKRLGQKRT